MQQIPKSITPGTLEKSCLLHATVFGTGHKTSSRTQHTASALTAIHAEAVVNVRSRLRTLKHMPARKMHPHSRFVITWYKIYPSLALCIYCSSTIFSNKIVWYLSLVFYTLLQGSSTNCEILKRLYKNIKLLTRQECYIKNEFFLWNVLRLMKQDSPTSSVFATLASLNKVHVYVNWTLRFRLFIYIIKEKLISLESYILLHILDISIYTWDADFRNYINMVFEHLALLGVRPEPKSETPGPRLVEELSKSE